MEKKSIQRIKWLDVIRSLAIMCVVMCHSVEGVIYSFHLQPIHSLSLLSKLFAFTAFSIGRLGVPFFLMITGYLLLDRQYEDNECKYFWKNKWLGLFITISIWTVIYNIFLNKFNGYEVSLDFVIHEIFLLKASPINHMWYMPMILGMYLTLPIVANALKTVEAKTLLFPYIVIFAFVFGVPTINVILRILKEETWCIIMSMGFSGGEYGIYLLTGYFLKKEIFKSIQKNVLTFIAGVSFVACVFIQLYAYSYNIEYNILYNNLFLIICAICCFELLSRIKKIYFQKVVSLLSKYAFAIYLIHNPIVFILKRYTDIIGSKPLRVIFVWTVAMLGSIVISCLINKIPKLGKVILYMK